MTQMNAGGMSKRLFRDFRRHAHPRRTLSIEMSPAIATVRADVAKLNPSKIARTRE
jgi:hypothetical protein